MKKYAKKFLLFRLQYWFTSIYQLQLKVNNFNSECLLSLWIKYSVWKTLLRGTRRIYVTSNERICPLFWNVRTLNEYFWVLLSVLQTESSAMSFLGVLIQAATYWSSTYFYFVCGYTFCHVLHLLRSLHCSIALSRGLKNLWVGCCLNSRVNITKKGFCSTRPLMVPLCVWLTQS